MSGTPGSSQLARAAERPISSGGCAQQQKGIGYAYAKNTLLSELKKHAQNTKMEIYYTKMEIASGLSIGWNLKRLLKLSVVAGEAL